METSLDASQEQLLQTWHASNRGHVGKEDIDALCRLTRQSEPAIMQWIQNERMQHDVVHQFIVNTPSRTHPQTALRRDKSPEGRAINLSGNSDGSRVLDQSSIPVSLDRIRATTTSLEEQASFQARWLAVKSNPDVKHTAKQFVSDLISCHTVKSQGHQARILRSAQSGMINDTCRSCKNQTTASKQKKSTNTQTAKPDLKFHDCTTIFESRSLISECELIRLQCTSGCGESFSTRRAWKLHEDGLAHPTKVWICIYCAEAGDSEKNFLFPQRDKLQNHIKHNHSLEEDRLRAVNLYLSNDRAQECPFCDWKDVPEDIWAIHLMEHFMNRQSLRIYDPLSHCDIVDGDEDSEESVQGGDDTDDTDGGNREQGSHAPLDHVDDTGGGGPGGCEGASSQGPPYSRSYGHSSHNVSRSSQNDLLSTKATDTTQDRHHHHLSQTAESHKIISLHTHPIPEGVQSIRTKVMDVHAPNGGRENQLPPIRETFSSSLFTVPEPQRQEVSDPSSLLVNGPRNYQYTYDGSTRSQIDFDTVWAEASLSKTGAKSRMTSTTVETPHCPKPSRTGEQSMVPAVLDGDTRWGPPWSQPWTSSVPGLDTIHSHEWIPDMNTALSEEESGSLSPIANHAAKGQEDRNTLTKSNLQDCPTTTHDISHSSYLADDNLDFSQNVARPRSISFSETRTRRPFSRQTASVQENVQVAVSNKRKYSCNECSYRAKFRKDVSRHHAAVHMAQKHVCPICGIACARKDVLLRHLQNRKLHTILRSQGVDPITLRSSAQ